MILPYIVNQNGIQYTIFKNHGYVEILASNETRTVKAQGRTTQEAARKAKQLLMIPPVDNTDNCEKIERKGFTLFINHEDSGE